MRDDIYHNITFIQVEALKESLDFLRNGYIDFNLYFSDDLWILNFRKVNKTTRLKVRVRPFSYVIERDGKVVKSVEGLPDLRRYDVELDSDVIVKAKRIDLYGNSSLIKNSVLPNRDAR